MLGTYESAFRVELERETVSDTVVWQPRAHSVFDTVLVHRFSSLLEDG